MDTLTQMQRDVIDKLNGFEISGKRIYIKTRPSVKFPRGKFFVGIIRFVTPEKGIVNILDDEEGFVDIYLSQIMSPDDIEEARRKKSFHAV